MAKVSRRSKVEEPKKQEEPKNEKILNSQEILKVETAPLQVENAKYFMAIQEQSLANMLLEQKLLNIKIDKQKQIVQDAAQKYQQAKDAYNVTIRDIMKNHSLTSEKFGYNSDTGEIIL